MAARVTEVDVRKIITTSLTDIDVFIDTANLFVNNTLGDSGLDDNTLTEIEKYLAAHFLSVNDQRIKSEKVDVLSTTYAGQFGMGLNHTQYGQAAILLDYSGTLGKLAKQGYQAKASMSIIGYLE